jgi:hypothetical protein
MKSFAGRVNIYQSRLDESYVPDPRRLPLVAKTGRLSQRLLPVMPGASPRHCDPDFRRRPYLLGSSATRRLLDALGLYRVSPRSAPQSKGAATVQVDRPGLPPHSFGNVLDHSDRPKRECARLVAASRSAGRCSGAALPVARLSERSVAQGTLSGDSARLRYGLPILRNSFAGGRALVLPSLWRQEVLGRSGFGF